MRLIYLMLTVFLLSACVSTGPPRVSDEELMSARNGYLDCALYQSSIQVYALSSLDRPPVATVDWLEGRCAEEEARYRTAVESVTDTASYSTPAPSVIRSNTANSVIRVARRSAVDWVNRYLEGNS